MIDDTHPCYSIKYLRNKPLKELKGEEFFKLVQAEEDRLIELKISIDRDLGPDKRYNLFSSVLPMMSSIPAFLSLL